MSYCGIAELNTQIVIDRVEDDHVKHRGAIPDVAVTRTPYSGTSSILTMETTTPVPVRMKVQISYEIQLLSLFIRRQKDKRLVAAIELLSRVNKQSGPERRKYLKKRESYIEEGVHLVEIDLLRSYPRMPFDGELPACDYLVMVHDAYEGIECDVWPIKVRQALPVVPVPLLRPDAPVSLDIPDALRTAYERARYDLRIDYSRHAEPPLSAEDAAWAATLIAQQASEGTNR